jgi:hypothetical protein
MTEQEFEDWKKRQEALGVKVSGTPKSVIRTTTTQVTREEKAACVAPLPVAKGEAPEPKFKSKTEREYHNILELRKKAGDILWFRHEGITLKLGDDCRYTPDFFVMAPDGTMSIIEVKGGFIRPDSIVKLRAAAAQYPFRFLMAQKTKDGWTEKAF